MNLLVTKFHPASHRLLPLRSKSMYLINLLSKHPDFYSPNETVELLHLHKTAAKTAVL